MCLSSKLSGYKAGLKALGLPSMHKDVSSPATLQGLPAVSLVVAALQPSALPDTLDAV